jgi:hypothetical protein
VKYYFFINLEGGMAYDPVKALQAAGLFEPPLPPGVEQALSKLSQDEVDIIISTGKSRLSPGAAPAAPWYTPDVAAMSGVVRPMCACGAWSGSGGRT